MLKYNYVGWGGYSKHYVSIFLWTSKLYFKSTNEDDYNTDKVCDYLEDTRNNDSKSVYIDDSIDANMESGNYKFGTQSHVSYQYDHYVLFKEHPMKAIQH